MHQYDAVCVRDLDEDVVTHADWLLYSAELNNSLRVAPLPLCFPPNLSPPLPRRPHSHSLLPVSFLSLFAVL